MFCPKICTLCAEIVFSTYNSCFEQCAAGKVAKYVIQDPKTRAWTGGTATEKEKFNFLSVTELGQKVLNAADTLS